MSEAERPPSGRAADPADEDAPTPAWQRGPDPDAPPWAEGSGQDGAGKDAGEGGGEGDAEERGADARADAGPAAGEDDDDPARPEGAALAPIAHGAQLPRPPRRTGVFVDPDDLRHHVGALLRAILGGYEVDAFGNFTFAHEGARVFVTVGSSPIGPQVGVFSVTNLDIDLTPALSQFLLVTNHTLGFGSFSYDRSNRAVWLRHTLLGTTLDGPELQAAVAAVAATAAKLDHAIKDQFGGRTFLEAPSDVQERVEPPGTAQEPAPPNAGGYL